MNFVVQEKTLVVYHCYLHNQIWKASIGLKESLKQGARATVQNQVGQMYIKRLDDNVLSQELELLIYYKGNIYTMETKLTE